jgi:hypothetical protein
MRGQVVEALLRRLDFHGEELKLIDAELARVALAREACGGQPASHGRITKQGHGMRAGCWWTRRGWRPRSRARCAPSSSASAARRHALAPW